MLAVEVGVGLRRLGRREFVRSCTRLGNGRQAGQSVVCCELHVLTLVVGLLGLGVARQMRRGGPNLLAGLVGASARGHRGSTGAHGGHTEGPVSSEAKIRFCGLHLAWQARTCRC